MSVIRPYYSDKGLSAIYYDKIAALDPDLAGDAEFYAKLIPDQSSVLELGAGTGRVTLALAQNGHSVLGVDLAQSMLSQAQAKVAAAPPEIAERIRLRRADMTAMSLAGETFDAVLCPFYALAHLPVGAAWRHVFRAVAGALKPGGLAAFHLPLADRMAEPAQSLPNQPVLRIVGDDGKTLSLFVRERTFKASIGRFDQVLDYVLTDAHGREHRRERERLTYYVADPTPFAESFGLEKVGDPTMFGDSGEVHVFRKP